MSYITTKDGTQIYYKDWGPKDGPFVTFSHGWPLTADAFDSQAFFLASHGCRCIAHDRRGHGRSSQPSDGNNMDTYADDLAELFEALDVNNAMMVGHSTGGGEVARYIGRHGSKRVAKAVLLSAVPPGMVKSGVPIAVLDGIRKSMEVDRAQFFLDFPAGPFFGYNRPGAKASQGVIDSWWLQGMMGGFKNLYECIKAFSETDFTGDLESFDVPALIIQGDDDQVVPIDLSGRKSVQIIPGAKLIEYAGAPHGITDTHKDRLNADLLAFLQS
jgi:non-heme chloroperoxidase